MNNTKEYGGIDRFRLIAAFLIVGIHTYPLSSINEQVDFLVIHVFARIAVPFFLMVTGYFLLPRYFLKESVPIKPLCTFLKKTGLLYIAATLLYFPLSIYAGYYSKGSVPANIFRNILFDGTFYHLWYLPASMIGMVLIYVLSRRFTFRGVLRITCILYLIGLLGDSYYGFASQVPIVKSIYDTGFLLFSYTRNGLFYAPVFLALGAMIANLRYRMNEKSSIIGFVISILLMLAEGTTLNHFDFQRHDSMYIALIPCMFFLFQFLLTRGGKASLFMREISMWIYILHPVFIIVIRGVAKVTGMTGLLIENSIIHYLAVCLLTITFSVSVLCIKQKSSLMFIRVYKGMFSMSKGQNSKWQKGFRTGRAWIELDMENLRHNINTLRSLLPDHCQLMPAVKANAYGHGVKEIARELNANGVRAFCVVSVLEGVELRKQHIKGEILVLGYTHPEQFHLLRRYHLTQTVIDHDYAQLLNNFGKMLSVHIKIDTGMHRLGERSDNIHMILRIFQYKNLDITGIYTHLCTVDGVRDTDRTFAAKQINHFHAVLSEIKDHGLELPKVHVLSSYGILTYPEFAYDYVRVGISLYGTLSNPGDASKWNAGLSPVLSVKARISTVKTIYAGEPVGYGCAFVAPRDMRIAVAAIGYGDGIPRCLSCGVGNVLINGYKVPMIGRICMDHIIVDVSEIESIHSGDIAIIIGKSGEFEITACDIAEQAGTISNEILSRLGNRLERVILNIAE